MAHLSADKRVGSPYPQVGSITLVEVLALVILLGLLLLTAVPKLDVRWFKQHGEFQQVLTLLRYAHQVARASECQVLVTVSSETVSLHYNNAPTRCGAGPVVNPLTGEAAQIKVSADIGGSGWTLDERGHPASGSQTLSIGSYSLQVEADTGLIVRTEP